jgi:nucleotide-binding universal stress UspA family protein
LREHGPILVPLDGSQLAEGALPYAVALAKTFDERIVLLTVWEGNDTELASALPAMAMEIEAGAREHFAAYLRTLQSQSFGGVPVQALMREGDAENEIARAATELGARAIVIATHGRSGIGRWLYGSTAARLLRNSTAPVMAVGPHVLESKRADIVLKHIMCPLDGTLLAEAALPVASSIAERAGARLSLVRGVNWAVQSYPYTLPDAYIPQIDGELEQSAKDYLKRKASEANVKANSFVVRGAVAAGLIKFVDEEAVDLVVMTTHGRSGIARAALGSTADRMLQAVAPVLLVRPAD